MAHLRNVIPIGEARKHRQPRSSPPEAMDTKADVAAHFKVSERTIERWMNRGMPYHKPFEGGSVRFNIAECDAWFRGTG